MQEKQTITAQSRPKDSTEQVTIYKSTDYDQFTIINGNRAVDPHHVTRLIRSITAQNLLKFNPIMVNEDYKVIDGQHRLLAAQALSLPIYYIIVEGASLEEVRLLNANSRNWSIYDFLESYIQMGNKQAVTLKTFMDEYHLTIEAALVLIYGSSPHSVYEKLRTGTLDFTEEELERARSRADLVESVRPFFMGTTGRRALLFRALMDIESRGLGRDLVDKLHVANQILRPQGNQRAYMRMFEDVLNYNRKSEPIRLF